MQFGIAQVHMGGLAMAVEQDPTRKGFVRGAPNSKWYKNLKRFGSCLTLLALLREDRSLIHELGPEDITVLHKGVEHGCVQLVKFVLVDMFDDQGHCNCSLEHDGECVSVTREELLRKTSSYGSTAVNIAVVSGSPKMVFLLEWAIEVGERSIGKSTRTNLSPEQDICSLKELKDFDAESEGEDIDIDTDIADIGDDTDTEIADTGEENSGPVPDVSDEKIFIVEPSAREDSELIGVIEEVLEDPGGPNMELMDILKRKYRRDVDFEFVPLAHGFLHFLLTLWSRSGSGLGTFSSSGSGLGTFSSLRKDVFKRVIAKCIAIDAPDSTLESEYAGTPDSTLESEYAGTLLKTLFNLLDPRGRTLLHVGADHMDNWKVQKLVHFILELLVDVPPSIKAACVNARDGAGRTILHQACIHRKTGVCFFGEFPDDFLSASGDRSAVCLSRNESLEVLKGWCFPQLQSYPDPLDAKLLAVLFESDWAMYLLWPSDKDTHWGSNDGVPGVFRALYGPLQLAAALGRISMLEHILKVQTLRKSEHDVGLGNSRGYNLHGAIHCAAYFGQVEAIQCILKYPVYDPIIQSYDGTALHCLLKRESGIGRRFESCHAIILQHVLPNSKTYKQVKNAFFQLRGVADVDVPRMISANEISCVNLLLQAGIDIWTVHEQTEETPSLGPWANEEARKWWFEKVVNEVVSLKMSVTNAANATSVVAALVATASFIGPLQPPLGYGDSGYVLTNRSPVRVYLVCNSLSFFFSIASILMAVLPAIPMPKESLYDELLRSQRCLKGAAMMLLGSIICFLISFSAASLAVVSSEWRERHLVVACVICGGVISFMVLVVYIIRLLRMLFHKNNWFRRKFAKHMYF